MRVLPLSASTGYSRKVQKKQNSSAIINANDSVCFGANYHSVYKEACTKSVNIQSINSMCSDLIKSALEERGLTINPLFTKFYNKYNSNPLSNIVDTAKSLQIHDTLIKSSEHPSPLVTVDGGTVSFHDPVHGEFGAGNINFSLDSDGDYEFSRSGSNGSIRNTWKFYRSNGNMKHYHDYCENGICNSRDYNRDGTPKKDVFGKILDFFFN